MPATKYAADFTYTDQEILNLLREALAAVTVRGQSTIVMGREFNAANLSELQGAIETYEQRVNAADATGPAVNYATFSRPL